MRVLLDTHVALRAVQGDTSLAPEARAAITAAEEIVVSVVSPWELVIKAALGRITLHRPVEDLLRELGREFGATVLPVEVRHVLAVAKLPAHHGDPFDRLLIAQAAVEGLTIVTRDRQLALYPIPVVAA